jgi:hypothetical protein
MPDFPPEILAKAAEALTSLHDLDRDWSLILAQAALDSVAEDLGNHVAGLILAHMEKNGAPKRATLKGGAAVRRLMRRQHFGTAARIAARAFLTDEDTLRQAARALASGQYLACSGPEVPAPEDER